jgi:RNA polymerase sigma factor (sigma-70 family)
MMRPDGDGLMSVKEAEKANALFRKTSAGVEKSAHKGGPSVTTEWRLARGPTMDAATTGGLLRQLRKAMAAETLAGQSDHELVDRFVTSHDEAAFHAILRRHGPMVYRVCRRVLQLEQDVEDVFQATFLVLARQSNGIRKRASIASWLHGVAYRLALNARKAGIRRRRNEMQSVAGPGTVPLADEVAWKEVRSIFDEELDRLPDRFQAPLVLCYLEGLTQDEAAERLGQSKGTFRRSLERGRDLLCGRLTRRGITLSAALFAPLLSDGTIAASVPSALAASTTEAAVAFVTGKAATALATARALALAHALVQPAVSAKVRGALVLVMATILLGFGGAALPMAAPPRVPTHPTAGREAAKAAQATQVRPAPIDLPDKRNGSDLIEFRMPFLVEYAAVQRALNLTREQVESICGVQCEVEERAIAESNAARPSHAVPRRPGAVADAAYYLHQAKQVALRKALPEILTMKQARRLRQLERQRAGYGAFLEPENQRLLGLTDEQRGKAEAIVAALLAKAPSSRSAARDNRAVLEPNDAEVEEYRKAEKAATDQILQMLTANQAKIWRDLVGESIELQSLHASELNIPLSPPSLPGVVPEVPGSRK